VNKVDTLLNLAWALLCVAALARYWWCERRRARPRTRSVRFLRGVAVFLAALLLFPCISISDDYARARLQDINSVPNRRAMTGRGSDSSLLLAMQLEETEHIRPVVPFAFVLALCFPLVILPEESDSRCPIHWGTLGRAPPAL